MTVENPLGKVLSILAISAEPSTATKNGKTFNQVKYGIEFEIMQRKMEIYEKSSQIRFGMIRGSKKGAAQNARLRQMCMKDERII